MPVPGSALANMRKLREWVSERTPGQGQLSSPFPTRSTESRADSSSQPLWDAQSRCLCVCPQKNPAPPALPGTVRLSCTEEMGRLPNPAQRSQDRGGEGTLQVKEREPTPCPERPIHQKGVLGPVSRDRHKVTKVSEGCLVLRAALRCPPQGTLEGS